MASTWEQSTEQELTPEAPAEGAVQESLKEKMSQMITRVNLKSKVFFQEIGSPQGLWGLCTGAQKIGLLAAECKIRQDWQRATAGDEEIFLHCVMRGSTGIKWSISHQTRAADKGKGGSGKTALRLESR